MDSDKIRFVSIPSTKTQKVNNFLSILQSSNFYNDSIKNNQLEWMFEAEETAEFMDWFCTYIGPENILKEEEINEYMELTNGSSNFSPLNQSQFHDASPALVSVTQESLTSLEEEVSEVDTFLGVLNAQYECLRSIKETMEKELEELEGNNKSAQKQLQSAEHTCINLSKKLDWTREKSMQSIEPLSILLQNLSGEHGQVQLLSQMPIKNLLSKYGRFHQHINLITSGNNPSQQFSSLEEERLAVPQQQMLDFNDDTSSQFITNEMKRNLRRSTKYWNNAIIKAKNKCVTEFVEKQENLAALKDILQLTKDIEAGLFQPSQTKLKIELVNFKDRCEDLQQTTILQDLLISIEQFANAHVMQMFNELSEKVEHHQKNSFKCKQMLLQCTDSQVCHCYLFFLLLVDEKLNLEDITQLCQNYSEPLHEELKQLSLRREKMKMIRVEYDARDGRELCVAHSLPRMLLLLAPPKTPYQQLFDVIKKTDHSIHTGECELLDTSFQVMEETFSENLQSLHELEKMLFTGTTKKPVVMDLDLSCQLYDIEMAIQSLQDKLKKTITECEATKEYISRKPSRNRRLLWVYFLTNYKKIQELIDGMESKLRKLDRHNHKQFDL